MIQRIYCAIGVVILAVMPTVLHLSTSPGWTSSVYAADQSQQTIVIETHDIFFDQQEVAVPADTAVTIQLNNEGVVPHNFSIDALGIDVDIVPGATDQVVINAPAGEYEYYCNVPGHKQAGMVGVLTAEAGATPLPASTAAETEVAQEGGPAATSAMQTEVALLPSPVLTESQPPTAGALTVSHLEAGTLAEGEEALATMAAEDATTADAQLGLGVIRFMRAIENLSQGLYRYGLKSPQSFMVPIVRLPVPENPNPQPITYEDFRGLIEAYVKDLALAEATLADVEASDVQLVLDLEQLRYDVDGDGTVADNERFIAVIQHVSGMRERNMPASLTFAFDAGDVLWLRAYSNVLMAFGEFLLAYDWQESFDASFFHFFPAMESPFRDALAPPSGTMNDEIAPIADFISFLHIRWLVSEPERMATVRTHLKRMIALSRESWDAIEAETDDDREWIPNARQTSPFATLQVDAERIAAWYQVLDEAEAVLDGEKLVPHWRFQQGFNLRRVFEEPQPFDLVLWITGPAAMPYLEDGPVTTPEDWARMTEAFGGRFGLFAIWVN